MNKEANQSFGKYIWQARRKKRLSQRDLADRVGIDSTYLSKLENDHVEPSEKVIRSLAEHLDLDADELTYLAGKMTQKDSEALEEFIKANYKEMPALFRRVEENPSIDSLVKVRDEQIAKLQSENKELKAKILHLEKELQTYRFYSKNKIEQTANKLLTRLKAEGFRLRWPFDAIDVADFLDLQVEWAKIIPDDEGLIIAKIEPLKRLIILNEELANFKENRGLSQSPIAHEIGHWILHINQNEVSNLVTDLNSNIEFYKKTPVFFCRNVNDQLDSYKINLELNHLEWQAQYFASCLLMPRYILEEKRKGRDLTKWSHLYAMKDELGVSISNLINRLQDLGWIYIPKGSKQIYMSKATTTVETDFFKKLT